MRDSYDFSDSKPNPYAKRLKALSQVVAGESAAFNKKPEKCNILPAIQLPVGILNDSDVDDCKRHL